MPLVSPLLWKGKNTPTVLSILNHAVAIDLNVSKKIIEMDEYTAFPTHLWIERIEISFLSPLLQHPT